MTRSKIVEIQAIAKGTVQGVSFRATTREIAKSLRIVGTVQNLPDSSVKIIAQGSPDQLELFFHRLSRESHPARVDEIQKTISEIENKYSDFKIIR